MGGFGFRPMIIIKSTSIKFELKPVRTTIKRFNGLIRFAGLMVTPLLENGTIITKTQHFTLFVLLFILNESKT
jgi:hypothetical protein